MEGGEQERDQSRKNRKKETMAVKEFPWLLLVPHPWENITTFCFLLWALLKVIPSFVVPKKTAKSHRIPSLGQYVLVDLCMPQFPLM